MRSSQKIAKKKNTNAYRKLTLAILLLCHQSELAVITGNTEAINGNGRLAESVFQYAPAPIGVHTVLLDGSTTQCIVLLQEVQYLSINVHFHNVKS
jgi:hypothetical protein